MSYVSDNLLNDERVVFATKLHWRLYIAPTLLTLIIFLPGIYFALRSETHRIWAWLPVALTILVFIPAYLKRLSSEFAVTNKRVIMKIGVISTRSYELLLNKVEGISVRQGLLGKVLDYGDIVVTGSGGTHEPFTDIQGPLKFRRAVQSVTDTQKPTG